MRDIPSDRCPMKKLVSEIFEMDRMKCLSLKYTKKNALINFPSVLPEIVTCSKDNIKHGFIEAGELSPLEDCCYIT